MHNATVVNDHNQHHFDFIRHVWPAIFESIIPPLYLRIPHGMLPLRIISVWLCPGFCQNLMHYRCSYVMFLMKLRRRKTTPHYTSVVQRMMKQAKFINLYFFLPQK